jgi:RNA polymerase sigma factor (sigma-70 family)
MSKSPLSIANEDSQLPEGRADGALGKAAVLLENYRSEQALWESFVKGDEAAFDSLYQVSFNRLFNYGMKLCKQHDLVKDAIHDLFIDLWKYRSKPSHIQTIRSYQYKALRNIILKAHAHNTPVEPVEAGYFFSFDTSTETKLILQETQVGQMNRLQNALKLLTHKQREVIFLKFFDQLSYEEVSQVLGISTKATYKLVGRAIAFLREKMILITAGLLSLWI